MLYYQCKLKRLIPEGHIETVTWMQEEYATKQTKFQMEDRDGTWRNDWSIMWAFPTKEKAENLSRQRDWSGQRKVKKDLEGSSDIQS